MTKEQSSVVIAIVVVVGVVAFMAWVVSRDEHLQFDVGFSQK